MLRAYHLLCVALMAALIFSAASCVSGGDNPDSEQEESHAASNANWDAQWQQKELDMLEWVNFYRAQPNVCGDVERPAVPPLEMNDVVQIAARLHSEDMGAQNYFSHDGLDGRDPFQRMEDVGYAGAYPWGENIQAGSDQAKDAVASLMTSPGHCMNITSPEFKVVGFGYAFNQDSDYKHYWTQNFGGSH